MAATLLNGSAHLLQLLMGGGIINTRKLVSWDMTQHGCPSIYMYVRSFCKELQLGYCGKQSPEINELIESYLIFVKKFTRQDFRAKNFTY